MKEEQEIGVGRWRSPPPDTNRPAPRRKGWGRSGGDVAWRGLRDGAVRNIFTSSSDFYEF